MAKYNVRIAPSALDDISDIADFYFELVDEESSQRFIDDVFDTITSLDSFPESNAYLMKNMGYDEFVLGITKSAWFISLITVFTSDCVWCIFMSPVSQANIRRDWLKDLKNWTNSLIS